MVQLPAPRDPTLDAIDQSIINANPPSTRSYLGMSALGADCERQLWYRWRWALPEIFDAPTLRRFDDGHSGEDLMAKRLRPVVETLVTAQSDGKQIGYSDFAGHLSGHLDGAVLGVHTAPKTWHVWEHKQVQEKSFRRLQKLINEHTEKGALEQWNATYYTQAQLYMGYSTMKRHYLTVTTPGGRDILSCRTDYNAQDFKHFKEKALRILESEEAPPRISNKPDYYQCRWCNFKETCHGSKVAQMNCRTCAHSTPVLKEGTGAPGEPAWPGAWKCEFHNKLIGSKRQQQGCSEHLFIPDLIPFAEAVKLDKVNNHIVYCTDKQKVFVNANKNDWSSDPMRFTSKDLQHMDEGFLESEEKVLQAMASFQTAHVETVKKAREKPKDGGVPFDDPIPF